MGRRWVPLVIVVFGGLLGLAVAGFPSRRHDAPITVRAEPAPSTTIPVAQATTTAATSPPTSLRPATEVGVMVFNSSGMTGVATRVGNRIKAEGWSLKPPGPDRKAQGDTVVMYRPGYDNEARSLAAFLEVGNGSVAPLDTSVGATGDAELVVLVGDELAKRTN
ncbi:MAG: LytR C-terminal domain-containing protein [Acidimicrobiales bacterium]